MLKNICRINTNINKDSFVGLKKQKNKFIINFPIGYRLGKNDDELRNDIILLLKTLENNTKNKKSDKNYYIDENLSDSFPISSYIYIMKDYIYNGYYKETKNKYLIGKNGKIYWNKTIKQITPIFQNNNAIYDKFIIKKNTFFEDNLITYIHQYCVYKSFKLFGWIYGNFIPQKPKLKYNKDIFIKTIQKKEYTNFNDKNKLLFYHMKKIINNLDNNNLNNTNITFGTNRFEYIWENMIDNIFGINNKKDYFPKTYWIIKNIDGTKNNKKNANLTPDSIMIINDTIYIIDAKYYKYGQTQNIHDLPNTSSISKQIIYGEYISKIEPQKKIYNVFLLPFNSNLYKTKNFYLFGTAYSEWKKNNMSYEQIKGVLVDTKYIMEIAEKHNKEKYKLELSMVINN